MGKPKPKAGKLPPSGSIPPPHPLSGSRELTFSFKHFKATPKFDFALCQDGYVECFFERLQSLSGWTAERFRQRVLPGVRNHQIKFEETTEPDGFAHLPDQFWEGNSWQFSLSANKHGRVHGIIVGDIFFVIWIGPKHKLYDSD